MEESCYIIEQYIKIRKDVDIMCNPLKILNNVPQQLHHIIGHQELNKMVSARDEAIEWLIKNDYHVQESDK